MPIIIEFINSRGAIGTVHTTTPKNDHYRPLLPTPPTTPNYIHDPAIPRVSLDSPLPPLPCSSTSPQTNHLAPLEQPNPFMTHRPPRITTISMSPTSARYQARNQNHSDTAHHSSDPKPATEPLQFGTSTPARISGDIKASSSLGPKAYYLHRYTSWRPDIRTGF